MSWAFGSLWMPCTAKKTVEQIVASKNNYCIGLKGNQPTLLKQAQYLAQTQMPLSHYYEKDLSKGRQVERQIEIFRAPTETSAQWSGLAVFASVRRWGIREGKPFDTQSWFILNQHLPAERVALLIREHRGAVENKLHWVKDVVQGEDRSSIRNARSATLMACFRSWAISAFRNANHSSITRAIRLFRHNLRKLLSFL
jgi:hypothetical protein